MIQLTHEEHTAVITLARNITNPINLDLVDQFHACLGELRDDPDTSAIVLTSASEKFFSIGFDLPNLIDLPRDQFELFFKQFNQLCLELYTIPKPVVAALPGHTIAGGCVLAICCDYRLIASGHKLMGLNEIKLGVPVPYLADQILHHLTGTITARNILESGGLFTVEESERFGLIDRIIPPTDLISEAITTADSISNHAPAAYALIKSNRIENVVSRVMPVIDKQQALFMECWYSKTTQELLKLALDKFR